MGPTVNGQVLGKWNAPTVLDCHVYCRCVVFSLEQFSLGTTSCEFLARRSALGCQFFTYDSVNGLCLAKRSQGEIAASLNGTSYLGPRSCSGSILANI